MKPAAEQTDLLPMPGPGESRIVPIAEPSVAVLLQSFLAKPQGEQSVALAERLFDLYEKVEARNAEKAFNAAFVKLQSELPVIVATTMIQNRGKYERFEDVMRQIKDVLVNNGFTVSFSNDFREGRVIETCHLRHVAGHSQSNSFAVRTGKGDSDTQIDCKAATTAKRNALLNCLNIVIRQDVFSEENEGDATLDGAPIAHDKAQYLKELVAEVGANEKAFLLFAGVDKYDEIPANRYDELVRKLESKRGGR